MSQGSHIEWTDATWNPITGCSVVSPGCTHCYAMRLAGTRLKHHPSRKGLTDPSRAGPVWNGQVRFNEDWLQEPMQWPAPQRIFVCAHGDLFHESVPFAWISRVFEVMCAAKHHRFQVLTKRAARMREFLDYWADLCEAALERLRKISGAEIPAYQLPKHIWFGVSCEDQRRANERVHELRLSKAAVRFVSAEPLLGPINFRRMNDCTAVAADALTGIRVDERNIPFEGDAPIGPIDWMIVGGESGPGARPMHPAWARQIRDDCLAAGVPFFFKQWGDWSPAPHPMSIGPSSAATPSRIHMVHSLSRDIGPAQMDQIGKKRGGRKLDGVTWSEFPA